MSQPFFFSRGIENSYPTIATGMRIDQMEKGGHYERYSGDFARVRDMGIEIVADLIARRFATMTSAAVVPPAATQA